MWSACCGILLGRHDPPSADQPINQSINQSNNQSSATQSISQISANQSINRSVNTSSASQLIDQRSANQSINQSVNQSVNQFWLGKFDSMTKVLIDFTNDTPPLTQDIFPDCVTDLTLVGTFNQSINQSLFPAHLKILRFGRQFNQSINPGDLPNSLEELELSFLYSHADHNDNYDPGFNQPIKFGALPNSLTSLSIHYDFNQPLSIGVLPQSLTSLDLPWKYSMRLTPGVFPAQLKTLRFGYQFDGPLAVGVIPASVKTLEFEAGNWIMLNRDIDSRIPTVMYLSPGTLPSGLRWLNLRSIDHPILPDILPNTLQDLLLGSDFRHRIDVGVLPASLKLLKIGTSDANAIFNQSFQPGVLPAGLEYLDVGSAYNRILLPDVLPVSLKEFCAPSYNQPLQIGSLPDMLTRLELAVFDHELVPGVLPYSLQYLMLGISSKKYDQLFRFPGAIPFGVKELIFQGKITHDLLPGVIPSSVNKLDLGRITSNQLQGGSIPIGVTHLTLRCVVAEIILPSSITHLDVLAQSWDHSILRNPIPIPSSVTHVRFGDYVAEPLIDGYIPAPITHIEFGKHFDQPINETEELRARLQSIVLSTDYPYLSSLSQDLYQSISLIGQI